MTYQVRTMLAALFASVVCVGCTSDSVEVGSDGSDADTALDGSEPDTADASAPTEGVWVRHNRAPLTSEATGGCHERSTHGYWGDQIVMQNASDTDSLKNVHLENNVIDR